MSARGSLTGALAVALLALSACSVSADREADAPSGSPSPSPSTSASSTSASPSPTLELITPVVGTCRAEHDRGHPMTEQSTVACTEPHKYETAFVGTFADAENAELEDEALLPEAFRTCLREVPSYVGSVDWVATDLWTYAYLPARDEWRAGARWFRCEIGRYTGQDGYTTVIDHTSPLENALADGRVSAYKRCALELTEDLRFVDCAEPHHREAMPPVYDLTEVASEYPSEETFQQLAGEFCTPVLLDYIGGDWRDDILWWANWPSEEDWNMWGRRELICSVDVETPLIASVEGIGDGPLPVAPPA